ncbi:MAG: alpha/beta fold hydrolase, partial [Paracoccaceae bacterium]
MPRWTWVITLIGGVVAMAVHAEPIRTDDIPLSAQTATQTTLPFFTTSHGTVNVIGDEVYSTPYGFRPLRLDLYQAPGEAPAPLVLFVHGGGWTIGNKRTTANFIDFPGVLAKLAAGGISVASIEYRLSGEAPFPAAVLDIKAAVRHLRANSARLGIDPERIAIWGGSAGAHLAATVAFSCDTESFPPEDPAHADVSDCVSAFVGWYGPYEVDSMLAAIQPLLRTPAEEVTQDMQEALGGLRFFRCTADGCPPDLMALGSPVKLVNPNGPPSLLIHGLADTLVPDSQTRQMAAALTAAGVPVEVEFIEGVGHGWVAPGDLALTEAGSRKAVALT